MRRPARYTLFPYTPLFLSDVLRSTASGGQGFLTFIRNSFIVAIATVLLTLLVSIPGAYAVARLEFFGRRQIGALFLGRSEEHTSELQSRQYLVCRLLLEQR